MQLELPDGISILGVNGIGFDSGNSSITEGRSLPWLQDTKEVDMWAQWDVAYRDVIIRDAAGSVFGIYNLTDNSLADDENYSALLEMALDAANAADSL